MYPFLIGIYDQHHLLKLIYDILIVPFIPQFSTHSICNEHLNYYQFGVVTSNIIMNIFVHVCSHVYIFCWIYKWNCHVMLCICSALVKMKTSFPSSYTSLHSHQQYMKVIFFPTTSPTFVILFLISLVYPDEKKNVFPNTESIELLSSYTTIIFPVKFVCKPFIKLIHLVEVKVRKMPSNLSFFPWNRLNCSLRPWKSQIAQMLLSVTLVLMILQTAVAWKRIWN